MRYSHQGFGTSLSNPNSVVLHPASVQALDMTNTHSIHAGSVGLIAGSSGTIQAKEWLN